MVHHRGESGAQSRLEGGTECRCEAEECCWVEPLGRGDVQVRTQGVEMDAAALPCRRCPEDAHDWKLGRRLRGRMRQPRSLERCRRRVVVQRVRVMVDVHDAH